MEIKVHTKLIWQDREFFLIATKPLFNEHRPNCNMYLAVPYIAEKQQCGTKIVEISVPKNTYMTVKISPQTITVQE